jgi:glycosyltransferase involved in cell wall biosynthesis
MIRVAIDARSFLEKTSGIGQYICAFIPRIVELADDIHFTVLRHPSAQAPIIRHPRVREIVVPGETKSVQTVFRPGLGASFSGFDLYHSPADLVPLGLPCPFVATIHDLMWIEAPKLASNFFPVRFFNHHWYSATIGYSIRRSRAIIAISHATAAAINRIYPVHAKKVHAIQHGIDLERFNPESAKDRSTLDPWIPTEFKYSIAVGQGSPYKNHINIVHAFLQATEAEPDHKLVLVRRFSRIDSEFRKLFANKNVRDKVIVLPFVPSDVLLTFYRHARMLLFISHYEGFGMPILEAMAMGIPVIASYAPALMEAAGDAALYAEASQVRDIAEKIRLLDTDELLREKLVQAGRRHVLKFSWDRCAREILDVYRQAIQGTSK